MRLLGRRGEERYGIVEAVEEWEGEGTLGRGWDGLGDDDGLVVLVSG